MRGCGNWAYQALMNIAGITEAKKSLSALARRLIAGRGRPVARREPVAGNAEHDHDGKLSRLLRDGVVRPRRSDSTQALLSSQPPRVRAGASGVDALAKERREGR